MNLINDYTKFVDACTSTPSKDFSDYITSLTRLQESGCDVPRLDCAINGLMSESGEAMEILKKLKFQGKEWDESIRFHLMREAGDILFYWFNLCIALKHDPEAIFQENIKKLSARYPNGFEVARSEVRADGDI